MNFRHPNNKMIKDATENNNTPVPPKEGWELSSFKCPVCSNNLFRMDTKERVSIWCGQPNNICPSIGANEGGNGKNEKEAWEVFRAKMGIDKN